MVKKRFIPNVFFGKLGTRLLVIIVLFVIIFPLLWMFSLSFRKTGEVSLSRYMIIPLNIETGNYRMALENAEARGSSVPVFFKNSIIITFSSIAITIVIASLAGYAFAKFRFKGRMGIFYMVLIGMMIPAQALLIPIFLLSKYAHILNTYFALILPYVAFGLPISIFILRGFFVSINNTMIEAARIDGATEFGILMRVVLPLARPAFATVVIFLFLQNWNEFMLALVLTLNKSSFTIPVGLTKVLGEWQTSWGEYSALVFMSLIPVVIVYSIFQNWFIKGLAAGSIKG